MGPLQFEDTDIHITVHLSAEDWTPTLDNIHRTVIRDGLGGPVLYEWPRSMRVEPWDDLMSVDATAGATVDDLIDDIDAVLDSYWSDS